MKTKIRPFELKSMDPDTGVFEGYASVFNVKDAYGDVVIPGAFAATLADDFGPGGSGIPCWWAHQFADPFMNIGQTLSAFEDDHGLRVKVALDLTSSTGNRVRSLLVDGRVSQMSFGYEIEEAAFVESDENGFYYELRKLRLFEVSVVPIGANTDTEILAAKSTPEPVVAALRAAHAAVLSAFKAAGVDPSVLETTAPVDIPGPDEVASAPTDDGGDDPAAAEPPAATAAGDTDPENVGDDEPDAGNAEDPVGDDTTSTPAGNAEDPVVVKSPAAESSLARARAVLALVGPDTR